MRFIFIDEAGTSKPEPVTVVVGIIADADKDLMVAEKMVKEVVGGVPESMREKFVFHAAEIFNGKERYENWSMTDRLLVLEKMMRIPRKVGMAVTISAGWRNKGAFPRDSPAKERIGSEQADHLIAFSLCLAVSDRNIRKHGGPTEVASVVAEDVPEMRKYLKRVPKILKEASTVLEPHLLRRTSKDDKAGFLTQSGDLRVERIRNSILFVDKDEDPLVQVADACAFGIRRFFSGQKFGDKFASAIVGKSEMLQHFGAPGGCECFCPSLQSTTSKRLLR